MNATHIASSTPCFLSLSPVPLTLHREPHNGMGYAEQSSSCECSFCCVFCQILRWAQALAVGPAMCALGGSNVLPDSSLMLLFGSEKDGEICSAMRGF
jgi:hypothetical protein